TPLRDRRRAAPWLGAVAGLAVGGALSRAVSMAAKPGQMPGIAATLGFDPRGYLWRLILLVVCPIARGSRASWIAKADAGQAPLPPSDTAVLRTAFPTAGGLPSVVGSPLRGARGSLKATLLACVVAALSAAAAMRSRPIANLFEDGHGLL